MGETVEKIKKQLNEFWHGTDKNKKMKLGIAGFLIVFSVTALLFIGTRPNYEVLYSGLSLEDAGKITTKLDEIGLEWKTGERDSTILVPGDMKSKIKFQLAEEGLPKDGYSYIDAFNDSSWTMTDYDKRERIKYALKSDLERDIRDIAGIEDASVYLDIPEASEFVLDSSEKQAKSSVFIKLNGKIPMNNNKVQAIRNLVAGAVEGMSMDNVTIIDDSGKPYTNNNGDVFSEYNLTDQFNIQYSIESRIDDSIKKFLENIFGYGNVAIRSSVKVNFDNEITEIHQFSPPIEGSEEGLIRSMEVLEEHIVNGSNGGIPGVETNNEDITDYAENDGDNSKYDTASKTINYELNEINKQIKKASGQTESVTVAILINKDAIVDGVLTNEKQKEIIDLIYAATGLDTKQVQVNTEKFNKSFNNEGIFDESPSENQGIPFWIYGVIAALALGAGGMYIMTNRKSSQNIGGLLKEAADEDKTLQEIDIEGRGRSEFTSQINKFVDNKPEEVAQLLRNWLNEE